MLANCKHKTGPETIFHHGWWCSPHAVRGGDRATPIHAHLGLSSMALIYLLLSVGKKMTEL